MTVRHELGLGLVLLVPNGDPWQKRDRAVTPAAVRLEMVRAAAAGVPGLQVSDLEIRRPGPSYTLDTIADLRRDEPDLDITVILGRDAFALLPTWDRHDELVAAVSLAVVDRPGQVVADDDPPFPATVVDMPRIDVSSSGLRRRVAEGRPVDVLVPPGVAALIEHHRLYRGDR